MRIFHLADLHLGKSLYERELVEDQRHALDAVLEAARTERPACVLIAGDVFDRAVPSAEAVALLGEFAASLKAIAGFTPNRLSASSGWRLSSRLQPSARMS